MRKTRGMELYELKSGRETATVIREGLEQGLGPTKIAAAMDITTATLYQWMRTLGLSTERRLVVRGPGE